MNKLFLIITLIIIIASIFLLAGSNMWKDNEYVMSMQANKNIEVNGLEFMMTKEEVRKILGIEDDYIHGWGCYEFKYIKEGIDVTFLNDGGTKFYNKVKEIVVSNSNYKIYNVFVGMKYDKAIEVLNKQGFKKSDYGWYWKDDIYIRLDKRNNQWINKIIIGVKDRFSSNVSY